MIVIDADGHVRSSTYDAFGDTDFRNVFEKKISGEFVINEDEYAVYYTHER